MAPTASQGDVTIRRADGSEVAHVRRSGESVEIRYGSNVLNGEPRDNGKRKYRSGGGPVLFEIKPGDSGFKLRTEIRVSKEPRLASISGISAPSAAPRLRVTLCPNLSVERTC